MLFTDYPPATEQPLCLSQAEWAAPKTVIIELFDNNDYAWCKRVLKRWLKTVLLGRTLARKHLQYVFELKDELLRLLEMATLLDDQDEAKSTLPEGGDWMEPRYWQGPVISDYTPFDYFPTSLSPREYHSPCRVFYHCRATYTLSAWRKLLEDAWVAGMTNATLQELQDMEEAIDVYRLLPKLLDAAHLIHVRELLPFLASTIKAPPTTNK